MVIFEFTNNNVIKHYVTGVYEGYRQWEEMATSGKQVMLQQDGKCVRTNVGR